jgi:nucleoside-diphosphate-sugar epimerase
LDESGRRVVVTAGRSPLARRVVAALRASPEIEHARGVEAKERGDEASDDLDFVSFAPDHRPFVEYLEKERIDTVIQCGLVPDRSGLGLSSGDGDVIGTMCLGAAVGHERCSVRSWVLVSSSAVYPIGSHTALLQRESHTLPREDETLAASIAEAEDYARDVAHRMPHVSVAILRLQQLAGNDVRGPLASLLASSPVPSPIGFDSTIQLLHVDDAASAVAFAARVELAGIYNVASAGVIHWSDAVRATGRASFPVLPAAVAPLEPILETLGIPFVPAELLDLLRLGHAVDTEKIERAGWQAEYDQAACLSALRKEAASQRSRRRG